MLKSDAVTIKESENMKRVSLVILTGIVMLLFFGCATPEKTAITPKPQHIDAGQQQEEVVIAPSSFYEACDKLSPGQQVEFSFTVSKPVDFNVHYHTAEGMFYPVQEENVDSMNGGFTAEVKAIHCCMWTNNHPVPVSLTYNFKLVE